MRDLRSLGLSVAGEWASAYAPRRDAGGSLRVVLLYPVHKRLRTGEIVPPAGFAIQFSGTLVENNVQRHCAGVMVCAATAAAYSPGVCPEFHRGLFLSAFNISAACCSVPPPFSAASAAIRYRFRKPERDIRPVGIIVHISSCGIVPFAQEG